VGGAVSVASVMLRSVEGGGDRGGRSGVTVRRDEGLRVGSPVTQPGRGKADCLL